VPRRRRLRGTTRRESEGNSVSRTRPDWVAHDRIRAGQAGCGRDRIRTCVGNAGEFTGRRAASSRVLSDPHLAPMIARRLHEQSGDSFGRHSASRPVSARPERSGVGWREVRPRPDWSCNLERSAQVEGPWRWRWLSAGVRSGWRWMACWWHGRSGTRCPTGARSAPSSSAVDQDRRARPVTSSIIRASPIPTIQASLARGCPAGWDAANPPVACRGSAGTSRGCPGQGGQPTAGQPGRDHRQHQGGADGELGAGQQAGELLGVQPAEHRIGSRRKAVELAGGGVVGAPLGQPGVEEIGAGDQSWRQLPGLHASVHQRPPTGAVLAAEPTGAPNGANQSA
jgi:hypothetical protein